MAVPYAAHTKSQEIPARKTYFPTTMTEVMPMARATGKPIKNNNASTRGSTLVKPTAMSGYCAMVITNAPNAVPKMAAVFTRVNLIHLTLKHIGTAFC